MKCVDCNEHEARICPKCLLKRIEEACNPVWDIVGKLGDKLGYPK